MGACPAVGEGGRNPAGSDGGRHGCFYPRCYSPVLIPGNTHVSSGGFYIGGVSSTVECGKHNQKAPEDARGFEPSILSCFHVCVSSVVGSDKLNDAERMPDQKPQDSMKGKERIACISYSSLIVEVENVRRKL